MEDYVLEGMVGEHERFDVVSSFYNCFIFIDVISVFFSVSENFLD